MRFVQVSVTLTYSLRLGNLKGTHWLVMRYWGHPVVDWIEAELSVTLFAIG